MSCSYKITSLKYNYRKEVGGGGGGAIGGDGEGRGSDRVTDYIVGIGTEGNGG